MIQIRIAYYVTDAILLTIVGNSVDKLRHPRSDAYSAAQVLLNKQQIWCGGAYLHCYPIVIGTDMFPVCILWAVIPLLIYWR